jgi:hypothetical protein
VPVEIAHYGEQPIVHAQPYWKIEDAQGRGVVQGSLPETDIPTGKNTGLGRIEASLAELKAPAAYRLVVGIEGKRIENDWHFWLYPDQVPDAPSAQVLVTHSWNEAEQRLNAGGSVLYMPRKADLDWTSPPLADLPVFWNRQMSPGWGRMLGLWIDKAHPALAGFPTAEHFDWQWSELVSGARAMNLDRLPRALAPIVQPIDDWNRNYKLGMLFEARVGTGRLMVATADLDSRLDERPVARQLRRSVLDYMASPAFQPRVAIPAEDLRDVLFDTRIMKKLGARASGWPDAVNTIDGDPNTYSLVSVKGELPRPQPELTIEFAAKVPFNGLVLMPRQNHREHEGDVREWLVEVSDDGEHWRDVKRATLGSTFDPQTVAFDGQVAARFLRLTAQSGFGKDRASALADVAILYTGPALPEEQDELEYKRTRSISADVDEAGMDERKPGQAKRR